MSESWPVTSPVLAGMARLRVARLLLQAACREGLLAFPRQKQGQLEWRCQGMTLRADGALTKGGGRLWLDTAPLTEPGPRAACLDLAQLVETLRALCLASQGPVWDALAQEMVKAAQVQAAAYGEALSRPFPESWDDFEAWTPEGHNLHPGAKTREGFSVADMRAYSPDFCQRVSLPWLAVKKHLLRASGYIPSVFEHGDDCWAVPVHPWQRREILNKVYADAWQRGWIFDLPREPIVAALSTSLRTVHPVDPALPLLKLSVGSLMTSTERSMSRYTVLQGPIYSEVLRRALQRAPWWAEDVEVMAETGGLSWADPAASGPQTRQLSLLFRQRPDWEQGLVPIPCSTLPQPCGADLKDTILNRLFRRGDGPVPNFHRYCRLLIPFHLGLYQEWGLALEAHLQNCLVLWSGERPEKLWVRDWGGLRANPDRLGRQAADLLDQLDPRSVTLSDGPGARRKLVACLFSNHLTEIVTGLTRSFGLSEASLWSIVLKVTRDALTDCPGSALGRDILERPWPVKALLRMRLEPEAGDLYSVLPNPLSSLRADVNDLGLDSHRAAS